ncbi:terminase small subunit [Staphylococcus succinus]|uniref:terminase small subunit n=1 Tax=Staphylococcus TaxID=1279 RepID=UPI000852BCD8|nr:MULTISPECIES: terminase small subunit [Staphylococcus]MDH9161291.1 terminase small subunit [Staphylococcus succinus]MDW3871237.1 terminase small subunit [Staphylococcus saprophyticus]MDW4026257.1 terminase small subunit [Staphylococcus saprophyticus]MDW4448837.1 terminase small subunit [Staphylococcus saprophyticus]OEK40145.1 terminase [Staphylococcus saprophyticus]
MTELNIKQQRFADEYIKSGNATDAYVKAGYSKNKANTNATKLLQNTTIKKYIKERIEQAQEESLMGVTEALAISASIARGEPQQAYSKRYDHLTDEVDRETTYTITPDFEERQRSIDHILKVHGAYLDRKEINATITPEFIDSIE